MIDHQLEDLAHDVNSLDSSTGRGKGQREQRGCAAPWGLASRMHNPPVRADTGDVLFKFQGKERGEYTYLPRTLVYPWLFPSTGDSLQAATTIFEKTRGPFMKLYR